MLELAIQHTNYGSHESLFHTQVRQTKENWIVFLLLDVYIFFGFICETATLPLPFNFHMHFFFQILFDLFLFSVTLTRCASTLKHSLLHSLRFAFNDSQNDDKPCAIYQKKDRIYAAEKNISDIFSLLQFFFRATANKKREKNMRWTMIFYVRWCSGWISALARDDLKIYFLHLQITRDTSTLFSYCVLNCVLITALRRTILRATDSEFSD